MCCVTVLCRYSFKENNTYTIFNTIQYFHCDIIDAKKLWRSAENGLKITALCENYNYM